MTTLWENTFAEWHPHELRLKVADESKFETSLPEWYTYDSSKVLYCTSGKGHDKRWAYAELT
jgi:hypothetical protein